MCEFCEHPDRSPAEVEATVARNLKSVEQATTFVLFCLHSAVKPALASQEEHDAEADAVSREIDLKLEAMPDNELQELLIGMGILRELVAKAGPLIAGMSLKRVVTRAFIPNN